MSSPVVSIRVGLATGHGTGPELAAVFERTIQSLAAVYNISITFIRSQRKYHSYSSLLAINDKDAVTEETLTDASHYRKFCEEVAGQGVSGVFRTSISAQALYLVRDQLHAVKVEHFKVSPTASILLVRDQAQGFYSGSNSVDVDSCSVSRTASFSKGVFERILTYALARAQRLWGKASSVIMVYKFHLFDGLFQAWSQEWQQSYGIPIQFIQGDTMNRNILAFGVTGNQLIISSNEYADIMQTILLDRFQLGPQEHACAENIYLHPSVGRLIEYQTAHGSADDIMGKGIVNPVATIRAAAALLEDQVGCQGVKQRVDNAMQDLWAKGIATPDQGGWATTTLFVDEMLRLLDCTGGSSSSSDSDDLEVVTRVTNGLKDDGLATIQAATSTANSNSGNDFNGEIISSGGLMSDYRLSRKSVAMVVVDLQNDFIESYHDRPAMDRVKANISRLVAWARQAHIEVIFVRFLGDDQFQSISWRQRNHVQGREPWCVQGTRGAEISSSLARLEGERVFDKKVVYDPFLVPEFEKYMQLRGFQRLMVVGLYADVCVDATIRSAFQRGLFTTLVQGCTVGLHFSEDQMQAFMQQICGTEVIDMVDLPLFSKLA